MNSRDSCSSSRAQTLSDDEIATLLQQLHQSFKPVVPSPIEEEKKHDQLLLKGPDGA